jgi:hypothetical protein
MDFAHLAGEFRHLAGQVSSGAAERLLYHLRELAGIMIERGPGEVSFGGSGNSTTSLLTVTVTARCSPVNDDQLRLARNSEPFSNPQLDS